MTQENFDYHCKEIIEDIKNKNYSKIFCLNYLKNFASSPVTRHEWQWIGQQLVMNGWLTVDDENNFKLLERQ